MGSVATQFDVNSCFTAQPGDPKAFSFGKVAPKRRPSTRVQVKSKFRMTPLLCELDARGSRLAMTLSASGKCFLLKSSFVRHFVYFFSRLMCTSCIFLWRVRTSHCHSSLTSVQEFWVYDLQTASSRPFGTFAQRLISLHVIKSTRAFWPLLTFMFDHVALQKVTLAMLRYTFKIGTYNSFWRRSFWIVQNNGKKLHAKDVCNRWAISMEDYEDSFGAWLCSSNKENSMSLLLQLVWFSRCLVSLLASRGKKFAFPILYRHWHIPLYLLQSQKFSPCCSRDVPVLYKRGTSTLRT